MGGVRNARMIKAQVCCSMGCKWCMAYAYILVCYVIPRASPSELHKHPRMYTYAIQWNTRRERKNEMFLFRS